MYRPLALFALLCFASAPVQASPDLIPAGAWRSSISALSDSPTINTLSPPTIVSPIPDLTRSLDKGPFTINLNTVFVDSRGGKLTFTARSKDSRIARAAVQDSILEVTPINGGSVEIRVTASDRRKRRKRDTFVLTVTKNAPPRLASNTTLFDKELEVGQDSYSISLQGLFVDPDEDDLVYEVSSSNPKVSTPFISGSILTVPASNVGETTITLSVDDQRGGRNQVSFHLAVVRAYPAKVLVSIEKNFGDPESPASYRLVALPGNQHTGVKSIAQGLPDVDWMAYAPDSTTLLKPFDGTDDFEFRPGRGLWFLQKGPWTVPYRNLPSVPLRPDGTYAIPLSPGWNIISNPFGEDIQWKRVLVQNNISQRLWRWDGGYTSVDTFFSAKQHAEAFYFYNAEGRDSLALPHPYFSPDLNPGKISATPAQFASRLLLSAHSLTEDSSSIAVGFGPHSETGFDLYDQFAPPGHFASLELSIKNSHPDFRGRKLAHDHRPPLEDLARFDLMLSASDETTAYLEARGLDQIEAERIVLVNLIDTRQYDLIERNAVSISIDGEDVPLALLVGRHYAVEAHAQRLTPTSTVLLPNYPNPFNAETTFEFTLSTPEHVEMSIYDTMGRRITTLLDGDRGAGLHRLTWQGFDDTNRRLANGVYFYRIRAGNYAKTKKLILLR